VTDHSRELLERFLSADVLAALDEHVREVAADAVRDELAQRATPRRWLTLREAAERDGCSYDAMRMRAERGQVVSRREGRTVYVSAESLGLNGRLL
jgi:hypothetical protein